MQVRCKPGLISWADDSRVKAVSAKYGANLKKNIVSKEINQNVYILSIPPQEDR
jgi:hypothetical protein